MKRTLFALVLLVLPPPAQAQVFPDIHSGTVIGRLTPGVGQPEQIPLSAITNNLTLPNGQIWIGNGSGIAVATSPAVCAAHQWLTSVLVCAQPAFSDISGSVAAGQLPTPTASTLGGIESYASVSHQWINAISTAGVPSSTQPACGDLSNAATSCSTDATNASNITNGTLAAARGGAGTISGALKGNGAGVVSQAACADLSNAAASCSTDATNANNLSSGTIPAGRGTVSSLTFTTGAASIAANSTDYIANSLFSGTEGQVFLTMPFAATVTNLYVSSVAAPSTGQTFTYTIRKNGLTNWPTCTISASATTCNDTSTSTAFAQGDTIALKIVTSATATATFHLANVKISY